jgi:hypothetical protein
MNGVSSFLRSGRIRVFEVLRERAWDRYNKGWRETFERGVEMVMIWIQVIVPDDTGG